jgi:hypothetical protein
MNQQDDVTVDDLTVLAKTLTHHSKIHVSILTP